MAVLSHLEPKDVFSYFEMLCNVPHGSGNTKAVSDLCVRFAQEHGLRCRQDGANNVVIWKDGTAGYESAAPVMLQGHLDMVCAKAPDCRKDMTKEGLDLMTDGETVWAKGTSLGGDDGIAVAMALAVLADDTLPHPPLEVVFTTDEETGMNGAFALDTSDLKARRLLNLDSEEEGVFTVSCAGGMRLDCWVPGESVPVEGEAGYTVVLDGLLGGHSGVEIDKGRANANHLMGRVLYTAMERLGTLRVADIRGGKFDNVICPKCEAKVCVPAEKADELEAFLREFDGVLKNEYAASDAGIALTFEKTGIARAFGAADTARALRVLLTLPQGVQAMSFDFPGLVQTSLNLGIIWIDQGGLQFTYAARSCIASQKDMLEQRVRAIVESAGGKVTVRSSYPGWQYAKESPLRELVMRAWREISGREGTLEATHGGLECGILIDRMPGLDAVSIGPDMRDIHSESEHLGVASTARVYRLVCEVLKNCR